MTTLSVNSNLRKLQAEELQAKKYQSPQQRTQKLKQLLSQKAAKEEKFEKKERIAPVKPQYPNDDKRYRAIDLAMKRTDHSQDALIEVLHKAQETFGYLDDDVLQYVTRNLQLPLSRVYGVATFYHLFSLKPQGKHNCVVCLGTACYVKGAAKIITELEKYLDIKVGETTPDNQLSLLTARCMGACGIAPAITIDGEVAGKQTEASVLETIKSLINSEKDAKITK